MIYDNTRQPELFSNLDRRPPVEHGDITAKKHGGNRQSSEANIRANKKVDNARIIALLKSDGRTWLKDAARKLGKERNCISGRFTWLLAQGYIYKTGETEEGCAVYMLTGKL